MNKKPTAPYGNQRGAGSMLPISSNNRPQVQVGPTPSYNQSGTSNNSGYPVAKPTPRATVTGLQGYSSKPNSNGGTTYSSNK